MTGLTRRTFMGTALLSGGLAVLEWGAAAQGAASSQAEAISRLTVTHPGHFRILQLTDLHFFRKEKPLQDVLNQQTLSTVQSLVRRTKPDLTVVTGDVWSENPNGSGENQMRYAVQAFEELGVPWAFVWGNHDQLSSPAVAHDMFTHARNSLYRGGNSDGNYAIDILERRGRRRWQILCLNSHRDGLQDGQRQWLRALGGADAGPIPRFAFFHIPLMQYRDAWQNGTGLGIKGEEVTLEKEDGTTLQTLKELGVRACFCGHDHLNDYSGVVDGVELVYGRVTRTGGHGTDAFGDGGKLITLDCRGGRWKWESVTPDGVRWRPRPGERLELPD